MSAVTKHLRKDIRTGSPLCLNLHKSLPTVPQQVPDALPPLIRALDVGNLPIRPRLQLLILRLHPLPKIIPVLRYRLLQQVLLLRPQIPARVLQHNLLTEQHPAVLQQQQVLTHQVQTILHLCLYLLLPQTQLHPLSIYCIAHAV